MMSLEITILKYRIDHPPSHEVIYALNLYSLLSELDLVIIATTVQIRREVIESVLEAYNVKYFILEKVVFQQTSDLKLVKD